MKNNFLKRLLVIALTLYFPAHAMAWGTEGHRVCGQIASFYLNAKVKKAIDEILDGESIAMASNWADFIKSDPKYAYLSPWHYIDFDKPYTYPEMQAYLAKDTVADAYTKINFLVGELKKKDLGHEKQQFYLKMLIHIVEDIHQPMHTAHAEDKGGNDIKVNWFSTPTNLHAVWDSQLIDFQQLSYTEYAEAIKRCSAEDRSKWQAAPLSEWIFESSQLANQIYANVKPGDTLNYKYNFNYIAIVNQQLLKGGVRLAGLLNQLFG
jgi:hypothetical protein